MLSTTSFINKPLEHYSTVLGCLVTSNTHTHTHTHLLPVIQFAYYDSSKDGKCHGSIAMRDIDKVEEVEPILNQGETGFFFTVSCDGDFVRDRM